MSSIIERPWSEEGWMDIRSGITYGTSSEQSNQNEPSTTSQAEEGWMDIRSGIKYGTSSEQSNQIEPLTTLQGSKSKKMQTAEVFDEKNRKTAPSTEEVKCEICYADGHNYEDCPFMNSVPKGAKISHWCEIVCYYCDTSMENDLKCRLCDREVPGRLVPNSEVTDEHMNAFYT